jgi:hypothetical protein
MRRHSAGQEHADAEDQRHEQPERTGQSPREHALLAPRTD